MADLLRNQRLHQGDGINPVKAYMGSTRGRHCPSVGPTIAVELR